MLKAPWTKDLKEENLVLVDKEYILSDYEKNESDIVYKANIDGKWGCIKADEISKARFKIYENGQSYLK